MPLPIVAFRSTSSATFGFAVRLYIEGEGGTIEHSELEYGAGLVMVSQVNPTKSAKRKSPASTTIVKPPTTTDYGDESPPPCA